MPLQEWLKLFRFHREGEYKEGKIYNGQFTTNTCLWKIQLKRVSYILNGELKTVKETKVGDMYKALELFINLYKIFY